MKYDKDELIKEFIECGVAAGDATLQGDYKTNNKCVKKVTKIYKLMERDAELAAYMISALLTHESVSVRSWAAADALGLQINVDQAIAVLEEILLKNDIGILRLNAEMCLKVYKEQGYLLLYQEK